MATFVLSMYVGSYGVLTLLCCSSSNHVWCSTCWYALGRVWTGGRSCVVGHSYGYTVPTPRVIVGAQEVGRRIRNTCGDISRGVTHYIVGVVEYGIGFH